IAIGKCDCAGHHRDECPECPSHLAPRLLSAPVRSGEPRVGWSRMSLPRACQPCRSLSCRTRRKTNALLFSAQPLRPNNNSVLSMINLGAPDLTPVTAEQGWYRPPCDV